MSEAQLSRFLAASRDTREKLWWMLMCDCGLRMSEVRGLLLYDIDRSGITVRGKGGRWRKVPVTQRVWAQVADVRSQAPKSGEARVCDISARAVQARFRRTLRRAGQMGLRVCPHSLRHTFATRSLTAGIDVYRVGLLLGHRSIRTTAGYLHASPEGLREAAIALDKLNNQSQQIGAGGV